MKKSSISLLIVFVMFIVTNGCSKNDTVQVTNGSKSGKIFKSRSEDEQEKREIKEFYARQGLEVDVSGFNAFFFFPLICLFGFVVVIVV